MAHLGEYVEQIHREQKNAVIEELERIKNEIIHFCDLYGIYDWGAIDIIDERINQLKGK